MMTGVQGQGYSPETAELYHYECGPFTVCVRAPYSMVAETANEYLIQNKHFGIDETLDVGTIRRASRDDEIAFAPYPSDYLPVLMHLKTGQEEDVPRINSDIVIKPEELGQGVLFRESYKHAVTEYEPKCHYYVTENGVRTVYFIDDIKTGIIARLKSWIKHRKSDKIRPT